MPLLLPPKTGIFQMVASEAEWSSLLDSLRPPKSPRPGLRPSQRPGPTPGGPTPGGRGPTATPTASPTPVPTATATATAITTAVDTEPIIPNFAEQIVLVAILGGDLAGESVQIVDVRQEANDLYVKVRISPQTSRSLLAESATDAVIIRRDGLPSLDALTVHFVDNAYQLLQDETAR